MSIRCLFLDEQYFYSDLHMGDSSGVKAPEATAEKKGKQAGMFFAKRTQMELISDLKF